MLRFSIIHPTPDGTFHLSSHHSQYTAKQRIEQISGIARSVIYAAQIKEAK